MIAAPDRAPDAVAAGTPEPLRSDLVALVGPAQVAHRAIDLVRYASDASPYRRIPRAVVVARDAADVAAVLAYGRRTGTPVVLRSGGTSLNGQGQTDGILVDVRRHFRGVEVLDGGARVRCKPGTVLGQANRVLAPYGVRIGPDPASTDVATVGGVVANNSGGMRCGTTADSYSTVRAMTLVLPSGTVVDTARPDAEERFARLEPALAAGLLALRDEIRADAALSERIRRKFAIKNTTGYRLCAFLDADTPVEILRRLVVGSEGTLAFIAEVELETVPVPPHTTVAWVHFASIDAATAPVADLVAAGATAVELMVAPALMVASHSIPGTPERWRELPPESAALLVELGAADADGLAAAQARAREALAGHALLHAVDFTREGEAIELAWRVREGLFGLLGKMREPGTALITEDVCVAPERMADSARDIRALLGEHGFLPGVAGHASAGNLHFTLTPTFALEGDRERYEAFIAALVDLIVDEYDGSLKAEHGTGVNMAPFVEREWGGAAYAHMWRVKALCDPDGVLAPGVVLNRDPDAHMRDLKLWPEVEDEVTACVDCGFCEPVCPSRDLTTTPRQRIAVRREMARQEVGSPVHAALAADFDYDVLQTCAADSTCALACPLGIDTGALVKRRRREEHPAGADRVAHALAEHWGAVEAGARAALRVGHVAGARTVRAGAGLARAATDADLVPTWPDAMAPPAPSLPRTDRAGAAAVYLPACVNRIFGPPAALEDGHARSLPDALVALSARAGLPLWIPDDVAGTCCATPWGSKGHVDGQAAMARHTSAAIDRWTDGGRLALVVDASSCTQGVAHDVAPLLGDRAPAVLDAVAWCHDRLLPRLTVRRRVGRAALHPTCSTRHLGLTAKLEALARAVADEVVVPVAATCCGFAGDRGLLHPELPAAALGPEAAELDGLAIDAALCANRTCEIGLEQATGRPFASFAFALEAATR